MLVLFSHQEVSQWWKKNICLAHSATAQEYYAKGTTSFQLEYQKSSQPQGLKYIAQDAKMCIFQDKNNSTLMEHTSEQASPIFSWNSFLSYFQKVPVNSFLKYTDSKYLEWEDLDMNWNMITKESLSTMMKSALFWRKESQI